MKKILSFLLLCACGQGISAQVDRLSLDFQNCANDTEFVIQKSLHGFSTAVFETMFKTDESPEHMRQLLASPVGTVVGPISENEHKIYFKSIAADSSLSMHVAHIIVTHSMHPDGEAKRLINAAYAKLKAGTPWTKVVDEYSEDGTVERDGDLDWFGIGMMVKPFEDACLKMKKGDMSVVETEFGWHIIWMKSAPRKIRKNVTCLQLVTK
jgi:peptidyl-prolyl cis-trans isomerase D